MERAAECTTVDAASAGPSASETEPAGGSGAAAGAGTVPQTAGAPHASDAADLGLIEWALGCRLAPDLAAVAANAPAADALAELLLHMHVES